MKISIRPGNQLKKLVSVQKPYNSIAGANTCNIAEIVIIVPYNTEWLKPCKPTLSTNANTITREPTVQNRHRSMHSVLWMKCTTVLHTVFAGWLCGCFTSVYALLLATRAHARETIDMMIERNGITSGEKQRIMRKFIAAICIHMCNCAWTCFCNWCYKLWSDKVWKATKC